MTLSIQTRCPQCYSLFEVSEEQLDQVDIKGRCGQCQQVFLVNDHLIASADSHPAILENDFENNKGTFNQQGIKHIAGRGSYNFASVVYRVASDICLGIETDSSANTITKLKKSKANKKIVDKPKVKETQYLGEDDLEAAALDSFNAWQTPITKKAHNDDLPVNSKQQLVDNVNKTSSHKAAAIDAKASAASSSTTIESKNSTLLDKDATQARSASVEHPIIDERINERDLTHDRALRKNTKKISTDKSLDKRVNNEPSLSETSSSTTNLTHLLTNKNTVLDYRPSLDQPYNNPVLDRVQPTAASTSTPVATLLWIAGCAVLVLLLVAQYVIFNLNTLIKNPVHAKRLQAVCSMVICALPNADLSALNTTQLSIRRSRVNTYADFSDLQAELVNSSTQAQLFPNLRVSVYSEAGLLGAFIATPEDYLLSNQSQLGGEQSLDIMFTIPLSAQNISKFTIEPIY